MPYTRRQQRIVNATQRCLCHDILEYVYSQWWQCRDCAQWWRMVRED